MPVPFSNSISIASGGSPPLAVDSSALCANLNADFLDGREAVSFADAEHYHDAQYVNSGTLTQERVGSGVGSPIKALFGHPAPGNPATWRTITLADIPEITDYAWGIVGAIDPDAARSVLLAAANVHTHVAPEVVDGVFDVDRLGSGGDASAPKVLFGSNADGGSGQWRTPTVLDVQLAAGVVAGAETNRITYWAAPGWLYNSPLIVQGTGVVTAGNFGTEGSVTCTDLVVNYAAATSFKSSVYTKIKAVVQGSGSITVTPNDGLQTLTLTSSGGASPPTTNADDVYVWVVDNPAGAGQWLKLVGAT